jgi:hypothetical protein
MAEEGHDPYDLDGAQHEMPDIPYDDPAVEHDTPASRSQSYEPEIITISSNKSSGDEDHETQDDDVRMAEDFYHELWDSSIYKHDDTWFP